MYSPRAFCLWLLLSLFLSSCTKYAFNFVSPDYQPEQLNKAVLVEPYLYQGVITTSNKIDLRDSLNYQVATMLNEQLPKYMVGSDNLQPIIVSPAIRRDLAQYLYGVRLDSEFNRHKTKRVKIPQHICEELGQDGGQIVTIFVSDGYNRTKSNYNTTVAASRAVRTTLALTTMAFTPYQMGKLGGARNQIQLYSSSLELFVLDVQKQEILKYQRNSLDLPPTNPFTIRQHLTALFLAKDEQ